MSEMSLRVTAARLAAKDDISILLTAFIEKLAEELEFDCDPDEATAMADGALCGAMGAIGLGEVADTGRAILALLDS